MTPDALTRDMAMRRRVVSVPLRELERVRITCKVCGTAVELPLTHWQPATPHDCPNCQESDGGAGEALNGLALAVNALKQQAKREFELVRPVQNKDTQPSSPN